MSSVFTEIKEHAQRIINGQERVKPGMPLAFTEASTPDDAIWQGDLCIVISPLKKAPKGFVKQDEINLQLVPGNTEGSKHCLESSNGVEVYLPEVWNDESQVGPFIMVKETCRILHPVHGTVTIPAGFNVECYYQREWDKEQARERRARD